MLVENGKAADVSNDLRNPLNWNTNRNRPAWMADDVSNDLSNPVTVKLEIGKMLVENGMADDMSSNDLRSPYSI